MTLRGITPVVEQVQTQGPLFLLRNADMQSTSDQQFNKMLTFTNYTISKVIAVRKTGAFSVTCIGGVYTQPVKGGSAVISALQTWAGLTGALTMVVPALASLLDTNVQQAGSLYLSLTTGNLLPLTADFFVFGQILD